MIEIFQAREPTPEPRPSESEEEKVTRPPSPLPVKPPSPSMEESMDTSEMKKEEEATVPVEVKSEPEEKLEEGVEVKKEEVVDKVEPKVEKDIEDKTVELLKEQKPPDPPETPPPPDGSGSEGDGTSVGNEDIEERLRVLDEKLTMMSGVDPNEAPPPPPPPPPPPASSSSVSTSVTGGVTDYREKYRVRKRAGESELLLDNNGSNSNTGDSSTNGGATPEAKGEPSAIVKSLLSRSSIFDQDSKRLEQINEKYEPKEVNLNLDDSLKTTIGGVVSFTQQAAAAAAASGSRYAHATGVRTQPCAILLT